MAGESKWSMWKLWNFALDGITGFSTVPLRFWSYIGGAVSFIAFIYGIVILLDTLINGRDAPGYASLMLVVLFLGGIQLISLGVLGEYLGRVYTEVKGRPLYIVQKVYPAHLQRSAGCDSSLDSLVYKKVHVDSSAADLAYQNAATARGIHEDEEKK
jgi:hypothetical protein